MGIQRKVAVRGIPNHILAGQYPPGIYLTNYMFRQESTNSVSYRFELTDLDVNTTGTDGNVVVYVQTRAGSGKSQNWRTVYTSEVFDTLNAFEQIVKLNMDMFRFKIVVQDSTVEFDLNAVVQLESGGTSAVQVNLPDKFLAGNEPTQNYDYLITYKAGSGTEPLVDKIYKFPKGSTTGDPSEIKTFSYDVSDNFTNLDVSKGILP